jgi:ABC-type branched-subunit amino acid transport system substrate-binding protein
MKRNRIAAALLAATTLTMTACSAANTGSTASSGGSSGGIAATRGVDPATKTITLGVIAPLTGPIAPLTGPAVAGMTSFWKGQNARGGVDGWKVNLIVKDNAFDPQTAKVAYQGMHDQIAMLGQMFLGATFTDTVADKMVMASGQDISLTQLPNNILVVPPLRFEASDIVQYFKDHGAPAGAKFGTAYFDIQLGHDASKGFTKAVDALGFKKAADVPFSNDITDFTSVVQRLKDSGAQYVFLGGSFAQNQQILTKAAQLGYTPTWGISGLAGFNKSMVGPVPQSELKNVYVTQALALNTDSVPAMAQLLADAKKYQPSAPTDTNFVLGYTTASIESTLLKRAIESGSLSADTLLKTLTNLTNVDTGGLLPTLSYGDTAAARIPSRATNVYAIDASSASKLKRVASNVESQAAKDDDLK